LGRLVVLVAIGFGVGLLFGVVTEEPELLAGHLRGESQSVALDSSASRSETPEAMEDSLGAASASATEYASAATTARPVAVATEEDAATRLPSVASPRSSLLAARGPSVPVTRATVAPESAAQRVVAPGSTWSIQVGAFSEQAAAEHIAQGLRARYPVEVLPASGKGGRWRVRVQPIRSEERAREMAERLKRDDRLPTWVTPMEDRSGS